MRLLNSAIVAGLVLASVLATESAHAIKLDFSYTNAMGEVFSGELDGEIAENGDHVAVSQFSNLTWDGKALPESYIEVTMGLFGTSKVSFSGEFMDTLVFLTNEESFYFNHGPYNRKWEPDDFEVDGTFGLKDSVFEPSRWTLSYQEPIEESETIPEPSMILGLLTLTGGAMRLKRGA